MSSLTTEQYPFRGGQGQIGNRDVMWLLIPCLEVPISLLLHPPALSSHISLGLSRFLYLPPLTHGKFCMSETLSHGAAWGVTMLGPNPLACPAPICVPSCFGVPGALEQVTKLRRAELQGYRATKLRGWIRPREGWQESSTQSHPRFYL